MKRYFPNLAPRSEDGAVAVEAAVCIAFILVPVLACVLLFGRFFWYYTVAQKAVHDAALYMSSATPLEIRSSRGAAELAGKIVTWETGDLDQDTVASLGTTALCGYKDTSPEPQFYNCYASTTPPAAVRAGLTMTITDPFLSPVTDAIIDTDGIPIRVSVTMNYNGH
jgi:hypothetical protein